jgi:hypothetical protein
VGETTAGGSSASRYAEWVSDADVSTVGESARGGEAEKRIIRERALPAVDFTHLRTVRFGSDHASKFRTFETGVPVAVPAENLRF